jgi:hypothetical protein
MIYKFLALTFVSPFGVRDWYLCHHGDINRWFRERIVIIKYLHFMKLLLGVAKDGHNLGDV